MKFILAFIATLACALAAPSHYYAAPLHQYTGPPADIKVLPSGFLADTPEVSHAKSVHSAEQAKSFAAAAASPDHESYEYAAPAYHHNAPVHKYTGPPADIKVLPSGYLADTPEVSHAKSVHSAEQAKSFAAAAASPDHESYEYAAPAYHHNAPVHKYTGPPADIKVLPSGFLADTPEVSHAKSVHSAEQAKSFAAAAASPDHESYEYATPSHQYAAPAYHHDAHVHKYTGQPADIKVLPSGYLADTPEVSHAKSVHSAEQAKSFAAAAASPDHESYEYAAPAYHHATPSHQYAAPAYHHDAPVHKYTGPPADIKVLLSGFLADTPEVSHAKSVHSAEKAKSFAAAAASPDHESYHYASPQYYGSHY